jgi:hypothetical protein
MQLVAGAGRAHVVSAAGPALAGTLWTTSRATRRATLARLARLLFYCTSTGASALATN